MVVRTCHLCNDWHNCTSIVKKVQFFTSIEEKDWFFFYKMCRKHLKIFYIWSSSKTWIRKFAIAGNTYCGQISEIHNTKLHWDWRCAKTAFIYFSIYLFIYYFILFIYFFISITNYAMIMWSAIPRLRRQLLYLWWYTWYQMRWEQIKFVYFALKLDYSSRLSRLWPLVFYFITCILPLGNLLGPVVNTTIEGGLDTFFRQPTGCGEQTMIYLAPNVYVLEYLMNTKQLSGANEENAYLFIQSGNLILCLSMTVSFCK